MTQQWLGIISIIFSGAFLQSVSGFGLGLVTMPVLTLLLGLPTAAVFLCTISLFINLTLTVFYRRAFRWQPVARLLAASSCGIIFGTASLQLLPPALLLKGFGSLIVGYALWSLFEPNVPELKAPWWSYPVGFSSGFLAGAYNIGGPPLVIYGSCCRWSPAVFKSNLNGYFLASNFVVFLNHLLQGNYRQLSLPLLGAGFLAGLLGLVGGLLASSWIKPVGFRRLVLGLLSLVGCHLLLSQ